MSSDQCLRELRSAINRSDTRKFVSACKRLKQFAADTMHENIVIIDKLLLDKFTADASAYLDQLERLPITFLKQADENAVRAILRKLCVSMDRFLSGDEKKDIIITVRKSVDQIFSQKYHSEIYKCFFLVRDLNFSEKDDSFKIHEIMSRIDYLVQFFLPASHFDEYFNAACDKLVIFVNLMGSLKKHQIVMENQNVVVV